jgi:hypothetical protein
VAEDAAINTTFDSARYRRRSASPLVRYPRLDRFARQKEPRMTPRLIRFTAVMLLGSAATFASRADSFTSSASSAGSASVGSSSDSIKGSSKSSSGDNKVADGNYEVLEVAAVPDRPGMLRLRLQPQAATGNDANGAFLLDLPQKALGPAGMAAGEIVSVHNRPYGLEFARAQTREPFFLALTDDWRSDLDAHPVAF